MYVIAELSNFTCVFKQYHKTEVVLLNCNYR